MEIKRKLKISTTSRRRIVIAGSAVREGFFCQQCGTPMFEVKEASFYFRVTQRRIFQLIELDEVHYTETETGELMICPSTVKEFLERET